MLEYNTIIQHHTMTAIINDFYRSTIMSPWLDLPRFWPGTRMYKETRLLQTWFDTALVNKLVSSMTLLRGAQKFRRFTHYFITTEDSTLWLGWKHAYLNE